VTVAVVPVKELDLAKGRLGARLGPAERRDLVIAMLGDVLQALSQAQGLSATIVVTRSNEIASTADRFGAELLEEPVAEDDGYTRAVDHAARELERRRAPAMLVVPGDVPAVTPQEIDRILLAGPLVLVPSRDERGTNAALLSPPRAFPLRFGEPSFGAHLEGAKGLGLRVEVLRLPGFALDLDTPDDLDEFMRAPSPTRTYRLLAGMARP
jgi:2-phospho-L-lactate guanylyltransferase